MYVIIVGAGRVGSHLAKMLAEKGQDVVIIEREQAVCEKIASELNAVVINGLGTSTEILEEAGIDRADVVAAVTGNDNENIVTCQLAKYKYKVPITMARVEDAETAGLFGNLGIDLIVSPSHVAAMVFEHGMVLPGTTSPLVSETITRAAEVKVPEKSKAVGKTIKELSLPPKCVIAAIYRGEDVHIPRDDTVIRANDIVAVIGKEDAIMKIVKTLKG